MFWEEIQNNVMFHHDPEQGMGVDQPDPEEVVDRRVSCDGERATVRYLGPVPPTAGKIR